MNACSLCTFVLCSIAAVYAKQGKFPEALKLYNKSLAVKEKLLGCEHPDVAVAYMK